MPSETFEQLLDRSSSQFGIDPGYWDIWGRYHTNTIEGKQAILRAMGVAAESAESLERSLADHARREWERLLPPAVVTSESVDRTLTLSVPAESLDGRARLSVAPEDGHAAELELSLRDL